MVIWITGQSKSGKSTTANRLLKIIPNSVLLEGEDVRRVFELDGFTPTDRAANIDTIARIAAMLERNGLIPIVACISPLRADRAKARTRFDSSMLIYMPGGDPMFEGSEYEIPTPDELL